MKKLCKTIMIAAVLLCMCTVTAFADMGSKPRVTIKLKNPPQELFYTDLLHRPEYPDRLHPNTDADEELNRDMLQLLLSYTDEGWYPAYTAGTYSPMWGNLVADQDNKVVYSYHGVPDSFKIIIATESGEIKTTDIISRQAMEINLTLDCKDMSYTTKPVWQVYIGQFLLTCSVTLLVEGLILLLFGFKLKENLKVFLLTNIFTQIVFSAAFASSFIYGGTMGSMMAFIPLEVAVTLTELMIYRKLLKGYTEKRKIIYAVAANIITAAMTWVNMDALMDFMFKLMR